MYDVRERLVATLRDGLQVGGARPLVGGGSYSRSKSVRQLFPNVKELTATPGCVT